MEAQKIEGISPDMLWTFMVVLVGLVSLFLLWYKVVEVVRKEKEIRRNRDTLNSSDVTDRIADKVSEKITPQIDERFDTFEKKFDDIDRKLAADKQMLELHTSQINAQQERVNRLETDTKAMCHGIFALLSHELDGGDSVEDIKRTHDAMRDYLIDGKYREDDWK